MSGYERNSIKFVIAFKIEILLVVEMIQRAKLARDEALAKAQFLQGALEGEKERSAASFRWIQGCRANDMEEILAAKGRLKVAEVTIRELENSHSRAEVFARLEKEQSMTKIRKSATSVRFSHAKKKAYKAGFKECKALAIHMLLSNKAHLLQVPIAEQPLVADSSSLGRGQV